MSSLLRSVLCLALVALAACGVETYRQRSPSPSLSIRMVASDGAEAEVLPRLTGDASEMIAVERLIVVDADHVRTVRLLDSADGTRVLVLDVDDLGRARLEEASRAHIGGRMAVVAGGRIVAAPTIRNPLTESEVYVSVPAADLDRAFAAISAEP